MVLTRSKTILKRIFIVFILFLIGWWFLSPYKKSTKRPIRNQISSSIRIEKPIHEVFAYLGNSANAKHWSVYVEEIVPFNNFLINDGEMFSTRRCFKNGENRTVFWDEEIIDLKKNEKRLLSIYNITGFEIGIDDLRTEQLYDSISENATQLTLTLFAQKESWGDYLKMIIASYRVKSIFSENLTNIKKELEKP